MFHDLIPRRYDSSKLGMMFWCQLTRPGKGTWDV